ncbi:MAG: SMI1/KNR4 family protein [Oscillospiraceae bacterium]|nr:SMI1/KNR4 family protein [Oscillospiraceae bacterium]
MDYTEELLWILDKEGTTYEDFQKKVQENVAFVHSLGLKCDCVGWSTLKRSDPRADQVLEAIQRICKEEGWRARGVYTRHYVGVESDWYQLVPGVLGPFTYDGRIETVSDEGEKVSVCQIRAYHEKDKVPKAYGGILVPERMREACLRAGIHDLDFCWAPDVGRFAAEQYFHIYGKQLVGQVAVARSLQKAEPERLQAAGGWLPRLAEVFHVLQLVDLPDHYLTAQMPEGGIAYVYTPCTDTHYGRYEILIHRDVAQILLREKAFPASVLRPAPVLDAPLGGYVVLQTQPIPRPTAAFMEQMGVACEALKAKPRPARKISEKDALKRLRRAKRDRKDDFRKRMPKDQAEGLADTGYAAMAAYYLVADGGSLSDEYALLPFCEALERDREFRAELEKEELLEERPDGVVIATCANGDVVLLGTDGRPVRFSHEEPVIFSSWPSLAQFFFEALEDLE